MMKGGHGQTKQFFEIIWVHLTMYPMHHDTCDEWSHACKVHRMKREEYNVAMIYEVNYS